MLAPACRPPAPQCNVEVIGCAASSGRLASELNIVLGAGGRPHKGQRIISGIVSQRIIFSIMAEGIILSIMDQRIILNITAQRIFLNIMALSVFLHDMLCVGSLIVKFFFGRRGS